MGVLEVVDDQFPWVWTKFGGLGDWAGGRRQAAFDANPNRRWSDLGGSGRGLGLNLKGMGWGNITEFCSVGHW